MGLKIKKKNNNSNVNSVIFLALFSVMNMCTCTNAYLNTLAVAGKMFARFWNMYIDINSIHISFIKTTKLFKNMFIESAAVQMLFIYFLHINEK